MPSHHPLSNNISLQPMMTFYAIFHIHNLTLDHLQMLYMLLVYCVSHCITAGRSPTVFVSPSKVQSQQNPNLVF